jgi:hypothetical protein
MLEKKERKRNVQCLILHVALDVQDWAFEQRILEG